MGIIHHFNEMVKSNVPSETILNLPVQTNMKTVSSTVSPQDPVSTVIDLMIKENVGAIVALEEECPVGIITEKDILKRTIRSKKDFDQILVKDIMSKPVITIEANQPIRDALDIMHKHNIRRLIITTNGSFIGLTTERRLLEIVHGLYKMKNLGVMKSVSDEDSDKIRVAYVSTYPPRECGIATYTKELVDAVSRLHAVKSPVIVAINDRHSHYDYGIEVKFQIDRGDLESYVEAARYINESDIDIVNLQHEYGLFDGVWGDYIITFLENCKKPVIATLHTVLQEPTIEAKRVMESILNHSDVVVVMARVGIKILEEIYGSPVPDKIHYIPHGCPNVPYLDPSTHKQSLGLEGRVILSTFGLLSRGKGIEYAIEALPQIVGKDPQILYLIIGVTHPEIRKLEGETYREQLLHLVDNLKLDKNVRFVNRFLTKDELIRYLHATDIYLIPYPHQEQISSGTLIYALSTGKAIVTTPFLQAKESLSYTVAMECEFKNPSSIAKKVTTLLENIDLRNKYRERAYEYSRGMIWPNVAMQYVNLFYQTLGR